MSWYILLFFAAYALVTFFISFVAYKASMGDCRSDDRFLMFASWSVLVFSYVVSAVSILYVVRQIKAISV